MGYVDLKLPVFCLDPNPHWTMDDLRSELQSLETHLTGDTHTMKQFVDITPFVMRAPDDDNGDDDDDTERSLMSEIRFSFRDSDVSSDEDDGRSDLMVKTSLEKGILFEIQSQQRHELGQQFGRVWSVLNAYHDEAEMSASMQIQEYIEVRREMERCLDVEFQSKVQLAIIDHLSLIRRAHEQQCQDEEQRIRDEFEKSGGLEKMPAEAFIEAQRKGENDLAAAFVEAEGKEENVLAAAFMETQGKEENDLAAAFVEAQGKEKNNCAVAIMEAKQEENVHTAIIEAQPKEEIDRAASLLEAQPKEQIDHGAALLEAQRKEEIDSAVANIEARRVTHAKPEYLHASLPDGQKEAEIGVLAAGAALREEAERKKIYVQDFNYKILERKIGTCIKQISGNTENVREKVEMLMNIIKTPAGCSPVPILMLAKKVVTLCDVPNGIADTVAFACGHVVLRLASQVPAVMDFVLAEFNNVCIYTVPKHFLRSPTEAHTDYLKKIGYHEEDGELESSDCYLDRVRSYMRLYAALIQTEVDGIENHLKQGWAWLARFLNTLPAKKSTSVALVSFLKMAGFALHRRYGKQFRKIVNVISIKFLPALKEREPNAPELQSLQLYIDHKEYEREPEGWHLLGTLLSHEYHA